MKTVRSAADLKRLAMRTGAAVELDGQRFNVEGATVTPLRTGLPASVSEANISPATSAPAEPSPTETALQQLVATLAQGQDRLAEVLSTALARPAQPEVQVEQETEAPTAPAALPEWTFDIERDGRGISAMRATSNEATPRTLTFTVTRDASGLIAGVTLRQTN